MVLFTMKGDCTTRGVEPWIPCITPDLYTQCCIFTYVHYKILVKVAFQSFYSCLDNDIKKVVVISELSNFVSFGCGFLLS